METKNNRMFLTAAAALAVFAACASAGAEDAAPDCRSMGGVLSSDLKTTVTLTCEGENTLGTSAVLRMWSGSGEEALDGGRAFGCPWTFGFDGESVRVTLYDENGSYYFEPSYTTDEGKTLVLMCADMENSQILVTSNADMGFAEVSFGLDMSGYDRCVVEAGMFLECGELPRGGDERLISGFRPLKEAKWFSDEGETDFTLSETGYMILPVVFTAGMDTRYYSPSAGDVSFTVTGGEGGDQVLECGETGSALFSLDAGWPFDGAGRTFAVSETVLSPYLMPQSTVYTIYADGGSLERNGSGYLGTRHITISDGAGASLMNTVQEVSFAWDPDGAMYASAANNAAPVIVFDTEYRASGEAAISGRVSLPARFIPARAGEFTLVLKEDGVEIGRAETAAGGTFAFDAIAYSYTDIGEKHYTVVQEKGDSPGVEYDENEYEVTVTISDAGDGQLLADPGEKIVFTNGYSAKGVLELPVATAFTGRWLKEGELTYGLFQGQEMVASAAADAGGNAVLRMEYGLEDVRQGKGAGQRTNTLTYRVRLITEDSDLPGVRTDRDSITVRVTLTDKSNGTIECTFEPEASNIVFSHAYTAEGTVEVVGRVVFTEGEMKAGQFSFVIRDTEDGRTVATAYNEADGTIVFPPIRYNQNNVGRHTLEVSQYTAETDSVMLDTRTYTLDVTVKDAENGTLTTSCIVTDSPDGRVTFENGYHAYGDFTPTASMTLENRAVGENEFLFQLLSGPDVIDEAWADAAGRVVFRKINYRLADVGDHHYTVRAVLPSAPRVSCAAVEYPVLVRVSDTGTGALTVRSEGKPPVFEFVYSASGSYSAQAAVTMTGRDLKYGELSFCLLEDSVAVSTGMADANGDIRFDPVVYTVKDVGVHEYTCVQNETVPGGVVRDGNSFDIVVTVSDRGDGTLEVDAEGGDDMQFFCGYEASGSYRPQARVFLNNGAVAEGQFTFEILENGRVIRTRQNGGDGLIEFSPIDYAAQDVGRHVYAVRQTGLDLGGIHLDRTVCELIVEVTDNGDGVLSAQRLSGDIRFNNEYRTVGTAYLNGKVILSGRAMREGEFAFEVRCGDRLITTGTNDADGLIVFQDMVFTQDDLVPMNGVLVSDNSLMLTVSMKPTPENAGLTPDDKTFTFGVGLRDLGNGTMTVTKSPEAESIIFRVSYEAVGESVISGTVRAGDYIAAEGDFEFELIENGAVIGTAVNEKDGTFAFPAVRYTQRDAGEHTYTVAQKAGNLPGMIYDGGKFDVVLDVKDDGMGTMAAELVSENPAFENRLANIGEMTLTAGIAMKGRPVREGEFGFILTEDGKEKASGTNDALGQVSFGVVYQNGDEGTHRYEIALASMPEGTELISGGTSAAVAVRPDGTGRMSWWIESEENKPFDVRYTAGGTAGIVCETRLTGRTMEEGQFTFTLTGRDGAADVKSCGADGRIVFDPVAFDETMVGVWEYTITQTGGDMKGYTLDRKTAAVTLTVEDSADGTLKITQSEVPVFENAYLAEGGCDVSVRAEVDGREIAAGEFVYILEEDGAEIGRAATDAAGAATLAHLSFTQADAGEHTYTVRLADAPHASLIPKGEETAVLTITVADRGDGTLEVSAPEEKVFSYRYHSEGTFSVSVRAVMSGRDIRKGEITYVLTDGTASLGTASVDETGLAVFPEVRLTEGEDGAKEYTVKVDGALPGGVTGDESALIKAAADDDRKGTITVSAESRMPVTMNYVYAPTGCAQIVCSVTSERVRFGEGDFTLVLEDGNGNQISAVNEEDGTVAFPAVEYTLRDVGEHVYRVRQEKGNIGGVVYDESVREVTVRVTEQSDGTLGCEVSEAPVFANGYASAGDWVPEAAISCAGFSPAGGVIKLTLTRDGNVVAEGVNDSDGRVAFSPVSFTGSDIGKHDYLIYASSDAYSGMVSPEDGVPMSVTVRDNNDGTLSFLTEESVTVPLSYLSAGYARVELNVSLKGRELKNDEFAFALVEHDSVVATARSDKNGRAGFDIFYNTDDTGAHTYQVMQLDTGHKGVTIQNRRYTVRVNVTDRGTGELETAVEYPENGIAYVNTYTASGELKVNAQVILAGRELSEKQFMLALYRDGKKIMTAQCDAMGRVAFDALPVTQDDVGLLSLELGQIPGNEAGITYDGTVYPLLVTVKDNGQGGITCEYAETPAFRNSYQASGKAEITSEVNLIGRVLRRDSFTLTMTENGNIIQQKSNDEEGVVRFDPIEYGIGDVGTHIYEISETATTEAGVPLSGEKQIVTVKVSDEGGGVLKIVTTGSGYVFRNSFSATAILTIRARLVVTGTGSGESPRLILKDTDGNVMEEITAVDGVNVFSPIAFSQADAGKRFVYTVSCSDVESEYTVEAYVSDGLDGTLSVSETVRGSEGVTDMIRFVIEYALELKITVTGTREAIPCRIVLTADGVELKGEYPVTGAAEKTISSGRTLTVKPDSTAVITDLPLGTRYTVTSGAGLRYTVRAENAEGTMTDNQECVLNCDFRTTDFRFRAEFTDENGVQTNVPGEMAEWRLYANGTETANRFEADGNEFAVLGLPYAGTDGKAIEYTARAVVTDANTTVIYVNGGENADDTDEVYSGGTVQLHRGVMFSVRVRFTDGGDEPVYTYRTVSAVLYNEEGKVGDVSLIPDDTGWCRLNGLDAEHEYYVVLSGVNGYKSANRNAGKYGNVTKYLYDGGTATFTVGRKGISTKRLVLYAGAGAALLGLAGGGVYYGLRRRRRK